MCSFPILDWAEGWKGLRGGMILNFEFRPAVAGSRMRGRFEFRIGRDLGREGGVQFLEIVIQGLHYGG